MMIMLNMPKRRFSSVQRWVNLFCAGSVLFGTTIAPVMAQQAPPQIVVDSSRSGPHPTLEKTQNGIDQVDIAAPNQAGVSHNMFRNYNVSPSGVILNNATHNVQTKIGGVVLGNANLNGRSAGVILNEVTGALPSQLAGYTEVAGQQAAVIIANPNGLTCNGCGFINTSRATLATGQPAFDAQGNVNSFRINNGRVNFEGRGADFTTVPILDILSRSVKIATQVNAQKVTMVLGRNQVAYGSNAASALPDDGSQKPELALDTTSMGGLYANSIYMVVNEAGAGVRVDGTMASNAGDMHLDGHGNLVLNGQLSASNTIDAHMSGAVQVSSQGGIHAQNTLALNSAGDLVNAGTVAAHTGGLSLSSGGNLVNTGDITADTGAITVQSAGHITNNGHVDARASSSEIYANSISNHGNIVAHNSVTVGVSQDSDNSGGSIGSIAGNIRLLSGSNALFDNRQGTITSQSGDVALIAGALTNESGTLQGAGDVTVGVERYSSDTHSVLTAGHDLTVAATQNIQNEGVLAAGQALYASALGFSNGTQGQVQGHTVTFESGSGGLQNTGSIIGTSSLDVTSQGALTNQGGQLGTSAGDVTIKTAGVSNDNGKIIATNGGLTVQTSGGALSNQSGLLQADSALTLIAGDVTNTQGTLLSRQGDLTVQAGMLTNMGGTVQGAGSVTAGLGRYSSDAGSTMIAGKTLTATVSQELMNAGTFGAVSDVSLQAGSLSNADNAHLLSNDGQVTLQTRDDVNNAGYIQAVKGAATLIAGRDVYNRSVLAAHDGLSLTARGNVTNSGLISTVQGDEQLSVSGNLMNQNGKILNQLGALNVTAQNVRNQNGALQSGGDLTATLAGYYSNTTSSVSSQKNVLLNVSDVLVNNGLLGAVHDVSVIGNSAFHNVGLIQTGAEESAQTASSMLHLASGSFDNSGTLSAGGDMHVESASALSNTGLLLASGTTTLNAQGQFTNQGRIGTQQGNLIIGADTLSNDNGRMLSQSGNVSLKATRISNQAGYIQANNGLYIGTDRFNNQQGRVLNQQGTLTLAAPSVINTSGQIESAGGLSTTLTEYLSDAASRFVSQRAMTLTLPGTFDNEGLFGGSEGLTIQAASLHNGSQGTLTATQGLLSLTASQGGLINEGTIEERSGTGSVYLSGASITNNGTVLSAGTMGLTSTHDMTNTGTVYGAAGVTAQLGGTFNNQNGLLVGEGEGVHLTAEQLLNNAGNVRANAGSLFVQANNVDNSNGQLSAANDVILQSQTVLNRHAVIQSGGNAYIGALDASLDNQSGILQADHDVHLTTAQIANDNGQILGLNGSITLDNATHAGPVVTNKSGAVKATGPVTVNVTDISSDAQSIVSSLDQLTLSTTSPLEQNGLLSGGKNLTLTAPGVTNGGAALITTQSGPLTITLGGAGLVNDGTIAAQGNAAQFSVTSAGALVNHHTLFSAGTMALNSQQAAFMNNGGKVGSASSITLQGAGLSNVGGALFSDTGDLTALISGALDNHGGILQAGGGIRLTAPSFDNSASGVVNAGVGGLIISNGTQAEQGLNNAGGTLQSNGGLYLATQALSNDGGRILQQDSTHDLVINAGSSNALTTLNKGTGGAFGVLQTQGGLQLAVDNTQGLGVLIAPKDVTVTTRTTGSDNFFQAGNDARLTVLGDYTTDADGGVVALNGNAYVAAHTITNQGALFAQNGTVVLQSDSDINNTGIIRSGRDMQLSLPGTLLNNEGSIVSQNGSLTIEAAHGERSTAVANNSGEIVAGGESSNLVIRAGSISNVLLGDLDKNVDTTTIKYWGRGTSRININAPEGLLDDQGKQATGYVTVIASSRKPRDRRGEGRLLKEETTYTTKHAQPILEGSGDVVLDTTGTIKNNAGFISAGHDLYINGSTLDNKGYQNTLQFKIVCDDRRGCGYDSTHSSVPFIASASNPNATPGGHKGFRFDPVTWGPAVLLPGFNSTIIARNNIVGTLSNKITNGTAIAQPGLQQRQTPGLKGQANVSQAQYGFSNTIGFNGSHQGYVTPTAAAQNKAVSLPGFDGSTVAVVTQPGSSQPWLTQPPTSSGSGNALAQATHAATGSLVPGSSGHMTSGQGQNSPPGQGTTLHVPSADLNVVVNSLPAGKSFFVPNPSPSVHYLLETRPRYATFAGLYGSDYLLNRLGKSAQDYQFLGDNGFDTRYVQQQIVAATGQSFLGGSAQNADQQMQALLDQANQASSQLGLTFGQALTPEQQSKLTNNIIWYVPVSVNGQTVLAPQLYLAPGHATLQSGGVISAGNDLSLAAGSIDNNGTMSAGQSLNLVATQGDIANNGGAISGKDVSLTSLAGSIANNSLLKESQTVGGSQQDLGQQGTITASGNARLSAAKDILFSGGSLQATGDASLVAGGGLTLGALTAQSSENIVRHHYTKQGNETKNYGSTVTSDGSVTLAALGGDLNMAGSGVVAGTSALLQAKGNVDLHAVTDHSYDYTRTVSSGFLSKKTVTQSKDTTTEKGSFIAANDNIAVSSGGNMAVAGSIEGKKDIALNSGGDLTVTALKNTESTYYQKKKSGLFASVSGGSFSVGFQKTKQTNTTDSTGWTASDITAGGDLSLTSHNGTTLKGSTVAAGRDLSIDGSSVHLDALDQTGKQTQSRKSFSVGMTVGLSSGSIAGQALQSSLSASQASGKGSGTLQMLTALEGATSIATKLGTAFFSGSGSGGENPASTVKLFGTETSIGFSKSSSYAEQNQSTAQGSSAQAGRDVSIKARGPSDGDKDGGSIGLTGAQVNAQNVTLDAQKNIALNAAWNSTSTENHSKSSSMSVGSSSSVDATGTPSAGASISGQVQKSNGTSSSKTAVDTVVTASQNVAINAPGSTTLNGAEVNGKRIDVHTGQLSITSPQNTSDYKSSSSQISAGVTVGTSPTEDNLSGGYTKQTITDHFATTGKTLSGLYSGSDGIGIDVSGDTTLKAGVISSTADASKNHLTTTHLDASDVENSSVWKMTSVGGQGSIGGGMVGSSMEQLGQFAKNMAANSLGMLGGGRSHDEHSTSQSAISGNVTVQAQSQSGHYTTDVSSANAALENKFDPQKLRNQMQSARVGAQLVGEAMGQLSDKLYKEHVWGFGDGGYLRTALEAGGNAGIAALTGGNIGGAVASTVAGNIAASKTRQWARDLASSLTDDPALKTSWTNAFSNIIASGAGALGGLAVGGGNSSINALSGAATASAIQQYNQAAAMLAEKGGTKALVGIGALLSASGVLENEHTLDDSVDAGIHTLSNWIENTESAFSDWMGITAQDIFDWMYPAEDNAANASSSNNGEQAKASGEATSPPSPPENEPPEKNDHKTEKNGSSIDHLLFDNEGNLIGDAGSSQGIRELSVNGDVNKAAEDLANKIVGEGAVTRNTIRGKIINGESTGEGWVKQSADGTRTVTFRPKGLSGKLTNDSIANIDVKSEELIKRIGDNFLKLKIH